jgi:hypothetical protein
MADIQGLVLPVPNVRSTDASPSPCPSMSSQTSDASLMGDAITTPATTVDSATSDDSTRVGDDKDALGTPRPDRKQQSRLEDDIIQLKAKLEELEKQAENDRERHKMMQKELYTGGPPMMGIPAMNCWDRFFNDAYLDPHDREKKLNQGLPAEEVGPRHVEGRKKVMMGILEAELEWMKMEDKAFTKLMAERDQLRVEGRRLAAQLAQVEERLRQKAMEEAKAEITKEAKAEEKAKEPAESEKDYKQVGVDSQKPATVATGLQAQEDTEVITSPALRHNKPQLNRVEWAMFTAQPGIPGSKVNPEDIFAIDVLEGDPVIAFQYLWWRAKQSLERTAPVTKKKQLTPGQGPLPERIRINSRYILKVLEKIDRDKFGEEDGPLVMIRPYKALVYYEGQIRATYQDLKKKFRSPTEGPEGDTTASEEGEKDESAGKNKSKTADDEDKDPLTSSAVALEQLKVLVHFLDTDIKEKIAYVRSDQCQRVSFADIWYLFRPGDEVIDQERKQAYRVIGISSSAHKVIPPWRNFDSLSAKSDETPAVLHCVYIDFDGENLGPVLKTFQIPRFEGERTITSLVVYPLRLAEGRRIDETKPQTFRQKLIARGKMFTEVLSVKHMNYNGFTLETRDQVDGQVMVDFEESFASDEKDKDSNSKRWRPSVQSLIGAELQETKDTDCTAGCCTGERVLKDSYAEKKRNEDYINSLIPEERSREPSVAIYPRALRDIKSSENALTDDDLVVMSYRVFGFILRSRKWGK